MYTLTVHLWFSFAVITNNILSYDWIIRIVCFISSALQCDERLCEECLIINYVKSMKYKTIVDKNESSLLQIIKAAESFNAGGFLESLRKRNLSTYEIEQLTDEVREYQLKMNREVKALVRFSETFLSSYATENNRCFETAHQAVAQKHPSHLQADGSPCCVSASGCASA